MSQDNSHSKNAFSKSKLSNLDLHQDSVPNLVFSQPKAQDQELKSLNKPCEPGQNSGNTHQHLLQSQNSRLRPSGSSSNVKVTNNLRGIVNTSKSPLRPKKSNFVKADSSPQQK